MKRIALAMIAVTVATNAHAQVLPYGFSVTVAPYAPAEECRSQSGCEGATAMDDIGTYIFSVHVAPEWVFEDFGAVRLTYTWPEDWVVTDVLTCGVTLVSGDPYRPWETVELAWDSCFTGDDWRFEMPPVLQFVIDCTSPGAFERVEGSVMWLCDTGEWVDFNESGVVAIGDYCGRVALAPCDICSTATLAGRFLTPEIDLQLVRGMTSTQVVEVRNSYCGNPPTECGGFDEFGRCVDSLISDEPWLSIEALSDPDSEMLRYEVTVDTGDLVPGEYGTRLNLRAHGCGDCIGTCQELGLLVLDPVPVEKRSWGSVKSEFGD